MWLSFGSAPPMPTSWRRFCASFNYITLMVAAYSGSCWRRRYGGRVRTVCAPAAIMSLQVWCVMAIAAAHQCSLAYHSHMLSRSICAGRHGIYSESLATSSIYGRPMSNIVGIGSRASHPSSSCCSSMACMACARSFDDARRARYVLTPILAIVGVVDVPIVDSRSSRGTACVARQLKIGEADRTVDGLAAAHVLGLSLLAAVLCDRAQQILRRERQCRLAAGTRRTSWLHEFVPWGLTAGAVGPATPLTVAMLIFGAWSAQQALRDEDRRHSASRCRRRAHDQHDAAGWFSSASSYLGVSAAQRHTNWFQRSLYAFGCRHGKAPADRMCGFSGMVEVVWSTRPAAWKYASTSPISEDVTVSYSQAYSRPVRDGRHDRARQAEQRQHVQYGAPRVWRTPTRTTCRRSGEKPCAAAQRSSTTPSTWARSSRAHQELIVISRRLERRALMSAFCLAFAPGVLRAGRRGVSPIRTGSR